MALSLGSAIFKQYFFTHMASPPVSPPPPRTLFPSSATTFPSIFFKSCLLFAVIIFSPLNEIEWQDPCRVERSSLLAAEVRFPNCSVAKPFSLESTTPLRFGKRRWSRFMMIALLTVPETRGVISWSRATESHDFLASPWKCGGPTGPQEFLSHCHPHSNTSINQNGHFSDVNSSLCKFLSHRTVCV